jgi:branched-chain amino acid transport system substrate-binding protein
MSNKFQNLSFVTYCYIKKFLKSKITFKRRYKMKKLTLFMCLIILIPAFSVFGEKEGAVEEVRPALTGEIPIGVIHAATIEVGPEAPAIEMAIEDINKWCEESGIRVKFVAWSENAEESATKAVERAEVLIGRGVKVIVGSEWSSHCKALLKLIGDRKVILLSQSSSSPELAVPGDYLFRLQPDDTKQALFIRRLTLSLGIKAAIVVYAREAYAEGLWKECAKLWKTEGIEIIESMGVDPEKKEFIGEFATINAKYKEALGKYKRDEIGIWLLHTYGPGIPMLTSMAKYPELMKATARVFDSDNGGAPGFIEYAGDICSQLKFAAYAFGATVSPKWEEWRGRYVAKAGYEPYFTAFQIYDCMWITALSILVAEKYDGPALVKVLPKVAESYFGVSGWCALNEAGDRAYPNYNVWQVVEGKWEVVGFYDGATDSIKWY